MLGSIKFVMIMVGTLSWAPNVLSAGRSSAERKKYTCTDKQYVIVINKTKFECFGCNPCGLGKELVVPCHSVIDPHVSTGDCKPCEPGFYHDRKDTKPCKKCESFKCFENQVGEGECPSEENQDESYCANKCKNGYNMNENGTKCELANINSLTNATDTHNDTTMPILKSTPYLIKPKEQPTTNSTSVINDNHSAAKLLVKWIIVVALVILILIIVLIWKRNSIIKLFKRLREKFCKEQNNGSSGIETNELLEIEVEKSDEERKKDESVKIPEQVSFPTFEQENDGSGEVETNELLGIEVEKSNEERKKDESVKIPEQEEGETHSPKQETSSGLKESTIVTEVECDTNTRTHPPVMQPIAPMNTRAGSGESKMQNPPQPINVNLSVTAAVTVNGV